MYVMYAYAYRNVIKWKSENEKSKSYDNQMNIATVLDRH